MQILECNLIYKSVIDSFQLTSVQVLNVNMFNCLHSFMTLVNKKKGSDTNSPAVTSKCYLKVAGLLLH